MNTHRHRRWWIAVGALLAALFLVIAGCADDSSDDDSSAAGSSRTAVSVEAIDGVGDVLVDSDGEALYTADQEADGRVLCTRSCADTWLPLTLPGGAGPSGPDVVSDELGVAERPDGERQLTFGGQPLYRFADDPMAGEVTGDGLSDTFDGRLFSWQVATADGGSGGGGQPSVGAY
jgi:predicted lipoprotein with Yx(FWY)xxD motif